MTARRWIAVAVAVLLVGVGAFSAGRFTAPLKTETRIEWRELTVEDLTRGYTFARTVNRTVYRNVITTITPDAGTVIADTSIEREGTDEHGADQLTTKRTTDTARERVTTVTLRPDWRVGLQVGASLVTPALPITGPLVLGASVERRIVGGVSAGLWANTVGAGGASVSVEF